MLSRVKTNLDLLEQETLGGSAPRPGQITMAALHHLVFYRPDALPDAQPTASKYN